MESSAVRTHTQDYRTPHPVAIQIPSTTSSREPSALPSESPVPWAGFAPPPAHTVNFRSDDLDQVRALISSYGNQHDRQVLARGRLGFSVDALQGRDMVLGWIHLGLPQQVRGVSEVPLLHLPLASSILYDTPEGLREATPDVAVLVAPGRPFTCVSQPGRSMSWCLPAHALERELLARRDGVAGDAGAAWLQGATELPLVGPAAQGLRDLQHAAVRAFSTMGATGLEDGLSHVRVAMIDWVAERLAGVREADRIRSLAAWRVRQVEEWIDAHATAPISLGDLCDAAGVGERWLESAFRKARGCTPMAFVQQRRLLHARKALLEPAPDTTVARVSMDAGLLHLGRFSQAYRRAFGESPSRTLAQARARQGACSESG